MHLNEHIDEPGDVVFRHACKLGFEGIVSKRLGSSYRSGRSKREEEEDWGQREMTLTGKTNKPLPQPDMFFGGRNCHADAGA